MTNVQFDSIEEYEDIETLNMYKDRLEKGYQPEEIMQSIYARSRDNARTPMQWSGEENGGFTTGEPWFAVNPNYTRTDEHTKMLVCTNFTDEEVSCPLLDEWKAGEVWIRNYEDDREGNILRPYESVIIGAAANIV